MKQIRKFLDAKKAAVVTGLALVAGASQATAFDTTVITGAMTDIAGVGTAVFAVYVSIKLFTWARKAL